VDFSFLFFSFLPAASQECNSTQLNLRCLAASIIKLLKMPINASYNGPVQHTFLINCRKEDGREIIIDCRMIDTPGYNQLKRLLAIEVSRLTTIVIIQGKGKHHDYDFML
jgi:hypothetical protein